MRRQAGRAAGTGPYKGFAPGAATRHQPGQAQTQHSLQPVGTPPRSRSGPGPARTASGAAGPANNTPIYGTTLCTVPPHIGVITRQAGHPARRSTAALRCGVLKKQGSSPRVFNSGIFPQEIGARSVRCSQQGQPVQAVTTQAYLLGTSSKKTGSRTSLDPVFFYPVFGLSIMEKTV